MQVRLILRDLSGKFCWDASTLYAPPLEELIDCSRGIDSPTPSIESTEVSQSIAPPPPPFTHRDSRDEMTSSISAMTSPPRDALRHRQIGVLPSIEDSADDLDNLDDVSCVYLIFL